MVYLYAAALALAVITTLSLFYRLKNEEENLMEDIPTINLNKESLEKHAMEIAYGVSIGKGSNCKKALMRSLDKSYEKIINTYNYMDKEVQQKNDIVPAAEWLLDNLYLIEREYKDIKNNMPKSYYKNLPVITKGIMKCYPRIYHIAIELVSHTDGKIDEATIEIFLRAYERNSILTTGELWAFPIMLRIALIQNISYTAEKISISQEEKQQGDYIAERIINSINSKNLTEELDKIKNEDLSFSPHFTERLLKVLRDNGTDNSEVFRFIDEKLEYFETSTEKLIAIEHQTQAAFQLSIGNCITSIRNVEALDWREAFERLSYVEQILREDPSDIYKDMDFESRDYYRHKIEKLSNYSRRPESIIAKKAVECAKEAVVKDLEAYKRHIGYYIIDDGVAYLKDRLDIRAKGIEVIKAAIKTKKVNFYIGLIILGTLLLDLVLLGVSAYRDVSIVVYKYVITAIAILIPCSEVIISTVNYSINHFTKPSFIPKLEMKEGIPESSSTVVIIPTLLNNEERVQELIGDLEVYYLANAEKNLYFALLGDFCDSKYEHEDKDKHIIEAALKDIKALNKKYCKDGEEVFYFFNRYRKYNEGEGKYLGWERKRGKIMEFNKLLRGDKDTSYDVISGSIDKLKKVKYVITLDADTELPRDSAKKLIGAMSHILNAAVLNKDKKKVERGYGLMQPRISVGILSANKTLFSRIFSGETGIDMYTTAVSDVYQDFFGEGIYTGKGIYDLDVFAAMLSDEIPENSVLSHDLLEGCYVRAALLTDVELIDGYPAYYNSSAMRLHRWVRGDWQLLPWLYKSSPLDKLCKWKIFDNLRRSLLSPSLLILLILALTILPNYELWLILGFLGLLSPVVFDVSDAVVIPARGMSISGKINDFKNTLEQFFLLFCFLPYNAYLMADAIIRTLYRLFISKRNLLEWQTAADVESRLGKRLYNFIGTMWVGSLISVIIIVLSHSIAQSAKMIIPSVLWFMSPLVAYYISCEQKEKAKIITEEEDFELRQLCRKTWAYFEDFVDSSNNYLAPDNYQEEPHNGIAPRTSPTNMGMGLTSNIVAFDFGYINIVELCEKLDKILFNMESLERYKGHYYNWYDTTSKKPLRPMYVSTVDSGNLVGYIWVVSESLREFMKTPILRSVQRKGLKDILLLAEEEIEESFNIKDFYINIISDLEEDKFDVIGWKTLLSDVLRRALELKKSKVDTELYWNNKVIHTVEGYLSELQRFFPWLEIIKEAPSEIDALIEELTLEVRDMDLENMEDKVNDLLHKLELSPTKNTKEEELVEKLKSMLNNTKIEGEGLRQKIYNLCQRLDNIAAATDFTLLYDKGRQLFSIGYDVEKDSIGNCYYDLLASESRQASFVAIAKGDVEQKHWFKLGRAQTYMGGSKGLVSWSGTMFEYLMPLLIMKNYPNTLLDETYRAVLQGQKNYCKDKKISWGISEAAYNSFDVNLNYQYKAFGIPGIGLKRGLNNELVISPYSTMLALQMDFRSAYENIERLINDGLKGKYGFYEAVDYTKERLPKGKKNTIIKCFMVHHQGMSLMALDNVINSNALQHRFHRIPIIKATELLLQERVPKNVVYDRERKFDAVNFTAPKQNIVVRAYDTAKTQYPETHLLSNDSYSLMISNSGSGYSKKEDMTIYRWREDTTTENGGMFFYIKNLNSNEYWSAAYEPCKSEGQHYEVIFSLDKAEFMRRDGNITTHMQIAVSSEDDAEVRKITLTNNSEHLRTMEITSYCEVTLSPYNADIVHPAFSNLFISTEYVENPECVIASRRPRAKGQVKPYVMQTVAVEGEVVGSMQYETSRVNFIGRGRNLDNPVAMENEAALNNTSGTVLDPIISIRKRVKLEPGKNCTVAYTTGVGYTMEEVLKLASKYSDMSNINRVFELAWTQSIVEMKYLGIKANQANLYQYMASKILFLNSSLKAREDYIKKISRAQRDLWKYGISGDVPIVLLLVRKDRDIDYVRQLLYAHEYWCIKGLKVDLVIVNLQGYGYIQQIQDAVRELISSSHARDKQNKQGGVFLQSSPTMDEGDIDLIMAISKLVIDPEKGALINQLEDNNDKEDEKKELEILQTYSSKYLKKPYSFTLPSLQYYNRYGGFNSENNSYVIRLTNKRNTPAPWINVIANKEFGFHISESGSSYTWYKNSRENKITPWSNDPITDALGEALYIRDNCDGNLWSICPKPITDSGEYVIEYGFGYANYKKEAYGIIGELTMFVPLSQSAKVCIVRLKNNTEVERKLSLTYYAQMVLGVVPQQTSQYISTYLNEEKKYIYARNPYSEHFGKSIVYLKIIGGEYESFTGDRREFLGRGGSVENPLYTKYTKLSNTVGSGLDPCTAASTVISLGANEEKQLIVLLGCEECTAAIDQIVEEYSNRDVALRKLHEVKEYWQELLGRIVVKTEDKSMDIMLNGWLMYQTIVCRYWARTAFYQSGGAYGFRDQLQDVMAISYLDSSITREQIVYSASRQFLEGDVQHWWHPVVDSGIRTRFSDDLLWLPYVTCDYINNTGDYSILMEEVPYLEDEMLKEGEDERYKISGEAKVKGTIYEHCVKAIERGLNFGPHNIPLMGSGDWNDGMSTVGNRGRGESIWLGWFLYSILDSFTDICKYVKDDERENKYKKMKEFIRENLERNAWDGGWYRRAYFDDGTPLGSIENDECQIDSLAQSWAVISGAGSPSRIKEAMHALERQLIKEDIGMILLLAPPFNKSKLEPGYIKGYVPGVRENGGQYTHAAVWVILALAKMGKCSKAWRMFNMINPINHSRSHLSCERYKVEPYVMAADVYIKEPHTGRGGWSWYTGAAGWMYRTGIEGILGLKQRGKEGFVIEPCIPEDWTHYEIDFKKDNAEYRIIVNRGEDKKIIMDGIVLKGNVIPYCSGGIHEVEVTI